MNNVVNFIVESGISLSLFALIYLVFLRKETFFRANRIFLLFSVFFSLVLPLLHIPVFNTQPVLLSEITVTPYRNLIEAVIVTSSGFSKTVEQVVISSKTLLIIYLVGFLFFALLFTIRVLQLLIRIRRSKVVMQNGYKLVISGHFKTPFSFLNYVFVPEKFEEVPGCQRMLSHELEHIKQGHTFDLILLEIMLIFQWFNPFVWLLKRIIRENHEYLADRAVLSMGISPGEYKVLLVSQIIDRQVFAASYFNYSLIKNRIKMMNRIPSPNKAGIKIISGVLLAVALVVVFACEQKNSTETKLASNDSISIGYVNDVLQISGSNAEIKKIEDLLRSKKYTLISATETADNKGFIMIKKDENSPSGLDSLAGKETPKSPGGDQVFFIVEEMPEFPGGEAALRKFISNAVIYPAEAQNKGVQGKVYVTFVVTKDGNIADAKIARGVDPNLDMEALRVVNSLPKWQPGKQKGKPVSVAYTVPISFVLK